MNRVRILLQKVLSLEKRKKKTGKKLLYSLVSPASARHIQYTWTRAHTHTHTHTCTHTQMHHLLVQYTQSRNNRVCKRGAGRLTHVNTNTYMVHRRKETKLLGPQSPLVQGRLETACSKQHLLFPPPPPPPPRC